MVRLLVRQRHGTSIGPAPTRLSTPLVVRRKGAAGVRPGGIPWVPSRRPTATASKPNAPPTMPRRRTKILSMASTPAPSNWVRFAEMESIQMLPPRQVGKPRRSLLGEPLIVRFGRRRRMICSIPELPDPECRRYARALARLTGPQTHGFSLGINRGIAPCGTSGRKRTLHRRIQHTAISRI